MPIDTASSLASSSLCSRTRAASFLKHDERASTVRAAQAGWAAFAAATARSTSSSDASETVSSWIKTFSYPEREYRTFGNYLMGLRRH